MKQKTVLLALFAGFLTIFACTNPLIERVLQTETPTPKKTQEIPTPEITQETPAPVTYTVDFDSNGGSAVPRQTVAEGDTATRPDNPAKAYHTFDNWYADSGLTTLFNFDNKITANTTVYAWWKVEGMEWIPAGTFMMGSPESEPGRDPSPSSSYETQHKVTLTKGFYMGKYPVTQAQYKAVMGTNPSAHRVGGSRASYLGIITDTTNFPVENVSWYDVLVFCNKLSMLEGLSPAYQISGSTDPDDWGETVPTDSNSAWNNVKVVEGSTGYRLPTEAQWEYACRAGTTTAFNTGATISDNTGWYRDNSENRTYKVGLKLPNDWGLYDMHGNVWEWCWDGYGYYTSEAQTDPTGPGSGSLIGRMLRGGGFSSISEWHLRSAWRVTESPFSRDDPIGFRVVRP
jgi:formylglycine-generating enzyme required for sulfatase activity